MTDNEMIERLKHAALKRDGFDAVYLATPAAECIAALIAERDALVEAGTRMADMIEYGTLADMSYATKQWDAALRAGEQ